MLSQLIQNFVHLEGGEDGLDQDGRAYRPSRQPQFILRVVEDIVPQTSFQVALHLRQVKIRPATLRRQLFGVVDEEQADDKQGAGSFSELILLSFRAGK